MKKYLLFASTIAVVAFLAVTSTRVSLAQLRVFTGNQGGTNIGQGDVAAGDVGKCLQLSDENPVRWIVATCGSGSDPFTFSTNFGATNAATTTPIWARGGLNASSTVRATLFEALDWTLATTTTVCAVGCEFTNVQTAIDAGWDNIKLKNETYTLTAPITPVANNLTVEGEGYNTVISCDPATVPTCLMNNNASQKSNLVFRDFTIDNSGTTGTGTCADISRFARSVFQNVNCQDFNAGYSASTSQTFYNNIENTFVRVSGASSTAFLFTNDANYNTIFNARVNPTNDDRVTGFYIDSHTMKCISCEVESYAGIGLHVAAHGHAFNGDMYLELNKINAQIDSGVENVNLTGNYADASTTPQNIVDNGARGLFVNARVQYEPVNYINGNPFSIDDVSLDYSDTKASNQLEISSTIGTTSLMIVSTKNGTWIDEELKGGIEFYGSDTSGSGVGSHAYIRAQAEGTFGVSTNLLFGTSNGGGNGVDVFKLEHDGDAIFTGNLLPDVSDGSTLGDATHFVSDLFLADEGVINWNNSDMTINHSTNNLTISGGELYVAGGLLSQGSTTFSGVSSTTFDGPGFRIGGPRDTGSSYYNVFQNADDILTIQRTGGTDDSFSLVKIAANPTCAPSCEGTLSLELNPNKFMDLYADDYAAGTQQYGARIQKRGSENYMPYAIDFYDGTTLTPALYISTTTLSNVGIGTTTPAYKLTVHGDLFVQGNGILNRDTTSGFACLQYQTALVDQWCAGMRNDGTTNWYLRDNINTRNKLTIPRSTATTTLLDGLTLTGDFTARSGEFGNVSATSTTGTNYFAGKTGVGTSSPWGLLSVEQTSTNPVAVFADQANDTTPFVIDASGNVAIQLTSSAAALSVLNNMRAVNSSGEYLEVSHAGSEGVFGTNVGPFSFQPANGLAYIFKSGQQGDFRVYGSSGGSNYIRLQHNNTIGTLSTALGDLNIAPAGGMVGIGTTSPSHEFSVHGGILASASSTFPSITATGTAYIGQGIEINGWQVSTSTTVCAVGCEYTSIQTALNAGWLEIEVKNGTYNEQITIQNDETTIIMPRSATIQCNGLTQSPCVSTNGKSKLELQLVIAQTQANTEGVGFLATSSARSHFDIMASNFATSTQVADQTQNTTFYNTFDIDSFDSTSCFETVGTQPNRNILNMHRCRPKSGEAGIGIYLGDARGWEIHGSGGEPTAAGAITGMYLASTTRDNQIYSIWLENNFVGAFIEAGAARNTFYGGSFTSNTTDYTDNGTNTQFIGVNDTGTLLQRLAATTFTGDVNPSAHDTHDLGQSGTAWANLWATLINGADYSYLNGWRTLESEKYEGYPKGIAFGNTHFEEGKVTDTMPKDAKPIFVVTEDFIEFQGRRITSEEFNSLAGGLSEPAFEQGGFDPSDYWYLAFLSIPLSWFMNRRKKHAYQP